MSVDLIIETVRLGHQLNQMIVEEVHSMTRIDWEINIEDMASRVAEKYGTDVAAAVFARYDATCFDDLNPWYYDQVFGDLQQIFAD